MTNRELRDRWPDCYNRGLIEMPYAEPVPAKPEKARDPGPKMGRPRITDPDVKAADRGDDHNFVARITGSAVHE